jgi:glycosyltransferase involved in cell wall biosynthesis
MTPESLSVCLLTYRGHPQSGGQGIYVRLLSRELVAMGHRVDVWSGPPYPELVSDVRLHKLPSLDLWNEDALLRWPSLRELRDPINRSEWIRTRLGEFAEPRAFTLRVARQFAGYNGSRPYDIVHDNQCLGIGLLDVKSHVPVIATIHHAITRDRKFAIAHATSPIKKYSLWRWYSFLPMQVRVARELDLILTISEKSARDIREDFGIPPARMRSVGNGINLEVFKPMPEIRRGPDRLITTISVDQALKGFTYLLDALAELRKARPQLHLTVIGCSRPREVTRRKIEALGLQRAITFSGHVSAEAIARAYAESTLAVCASLYEGFGFPAGEAMACGVPLVSTRGGALPEVVGEDGSAGVLVEPGNAAALARAIRDLLDAPEEVRQRMGDAGRHRVHEHFTWRRAAQRTVECYREAIESRSPELSPSKIRITAPNLALATGPSLFNPDVPSGQVEPC